MQRRKAIQQLAILSSGIALLPGCDFNWQSKAVIETFENLYFRDDQFQLIELVQQTILPLEGTWQEYQGSLYRFLLRTLNDCLLWEDLELYTGGLDEFEQFLAHEYQQDFVALSPAMRTEAVENALLMGEAGDCLPFFIQATKGCTLHGITQTPFFQETYRDYQFAPAFYEGSAPI